MPVNTAKSKSKPINLAKAKVASDNIKTLKKMNSSLQSSYHNKQPFIPSGAIHETLSPSTSPSRMRHSVSSSFGTASPPRSPSPAPHGGSYLMDMTTSSWKSEQQRNFSENYAIIQAHDNRPAGLTSDALGRSKTSYSWDPSEKEKLDYATKPEYRFANEGKSIERREKRSEQVDEFQWREPSQPTKVVKRNQVSAPMAVDGRLFDASKWTSEYDETAAKFERNRHEGNRDPVAGISTANNEHPPTLFAWEKQQEEGITHEPEPSFDHLVGNSEYKASFTPHSLQYKGTAKGDKNKSKVFPTGTSANPYSEYRKTSVYRDDYTEKHVDRSNASTISPVNKERTNPIKYAWSLGEPTDTKPTATSKPSLVRQHSVSEYAREYNWPPMDALAHDQEVHKDHDSDRVRTILQPQPQHSARNVRTEYEEQFHDVSQYVEPAAPVLRKDENPPQFAWSVYDGEIEDQPRRRAPKSPIRQAKENTEYYAKYRWPIATKDLSHPPVRDDYESKFGKLYAVDAEDQDASQWKTEYDAQCAKLRQKQFELSSHVAGVKTKRISDVPSNFVWREMDGVDTTRPPTAVVSEQHHVSPDHFHTEYEDQYLRWKVPAGAQEDPYHRAQKQKDSLNLFEPSEETKNTTPIKSEYDAKFNHLGTQAQDDAYKTIRFKSQTSSESAPPQFAWPLVDKLPPPPPVKTPTVPAEKSEYEESFRWPQKPPPPVVHKPVDTMPPMALDGPQEEWKSEYAQHATEDLRTKKVPDAVAGIKLERDSSVPTFFAWPKQQPAEAPKPRNPYVQYANPEVVHTEYADKFQAFDASQRPKSFKETDQLQLFGEKGAKTPKTEYEASFKGIDVTAAPRTESVDVRDANRPPQFAWSLLPPPPPMRPATPTNKSSGKFDDRTEYGTQFQWKDGKHYLPQPAFSSACVDHLHSSGALVAGDANTAVVNPSTVSDEATTPREWSTEYQDRCQQLRQRQIEMLEAEKQQRFATPVAGIANKRDENAPAFYAWNGADASPPSPAVTMPKKVAVPTEKTEYDSKFVNWQEPKPKTSNQRREDTFKDIFGDAVPLCEDQKKTEYDSKFNPNNTVHDGVNLPTPSYHPRYERTLPCTNLDRTLPPPAPAASLDYLSPKPVVVEKYRFNGSSEYRDHFAWPEKSAYSNTPLALTPRRSSVPYGGAPVTTNHAHSDPNKESRASVLNTIAAVSSSQATPLTETQAQFAWPKAAQAEANNNNSSTSQQYKLMDERVEDLLHHRSAALVESRKASVQHQQRPRALSASPSFRKSNVYRPTFSRSQAISQTLGAHHSPVTTPPRKKVSGQTVMNNKYHHKTSFVSDHHSVGEGSTVLTTGSAAGDSAYSDGYEESKSPSLGTRTITTTTNTTATRVPSSFQATTGTIMSQDSLNPTTMTTNSMATIRPRTAGSTTSATTTSSSTTAHGASMTIDSLNLETTQRPGRDFRRRETDLYASSIPGLRTTDYHTMSQYRSRSAPPRKHLGTTFPPSQKTKLFVDNSPSNPVLMNRRYPEINDHQGTRWSTEMKDSYRWRNYNSTTNVTTTIIQ